jgi:hypothetical protein
MTETRSHLIRVSPGRVRVLRLACDGQRCYPLRYTVWRDRPHCFVCGCTNRYSCAGGCQWWDSARRLCSRCARRIGR